MNRTHGRRYTEAIGEGLRRIPAPVLDRLGHVQFVAGVDPIFAGLHRYAETSKGWAYNQTAHCLYPHHIDRPRAERVTTVVLPTRTTANVRTVVHEMGHALDEVLDFHHDAAPVSSYAQTNRMEAFAEAFTAWVLPEVYPWADEHMDAASRHLMAEVCAA